MTERIEQPALATRDIVGVAAEYQAEAGPNLFGAWLVELTYERLGTAGVRRGYVSDDLDEPRKFVNHSLQRRAKARKRNGVAYGFWELIDLWRWLRLRVESGVLSAQPS